MANKKRLIDADALKKAMCYKCNDEYPDEPCEPSDCVFCNAINDAPTMDAVEVVRCKDCGKSRTWGNEGTLLCYRDETTIHVVKPDAYCDGSQRRCAADDSEVLEFEPVVRCKDCIRWDSETGWCHKHSRFYNGGMCWDMFNDDDFCSFGERRIK